MKIIVPMAGMGKRMRPHTLTVPKPLLPIAGKSIVERLIGDIAGLCNQSIDEVAFIIGRSFGNEIEQSLVSAAERIGSKGSIYYQDEALGTAHAIYCAEQSLSGPVVVAFADTLFHADFELAVEQDGIIWTKKVDDPSAFGVVQTDDDGIINSFVEKPEQFISDQAIIGIYYFKQAEVLKEEIKYLLDNDIREKGEYQITNALDNMKNKGMKFKSQVVDKWMDCGNYRATVETNREVLELISSKEDLVSKSANIQSSVIIEPCYIAEGVVVKNSIVGPHVSLGKNTIVEQSVVKDSIVYANSQIAGMNLAGSMIGNSVQLNEAPKEMSIGDFSTTA